MVSRVDTAVERADIFDLVVLSVDLLLLSSSVTSDWTSGVGNEVQMVSMKVICATLDIINESEGNYVLVVLSVDLLLLLLLVTLDWTSGAGNEVRMVLAKVTIGDMLEDKLEILRKLSGRRGTTSFSSIQWRVIAETGSSGGLLDD